MRTTSEPIKEGRTRSGFASKPDTSSRTRQRRGPSRGKGRFCHRIMPDRATAPAKPENRDRQHLDDPIAGDINLLRLGGSSERRSRTAASVRQWEKKRRWTATPPREGKGGDGRDRRSSRRSFRRPILSSPELREPNLKNKEPNSKLGRLLFQIPFLLYSFFLLFCW